MDWRIARCHEENVYRQILTALLAEVCRRSTGQTIVAQHLLCLDADLDHLYFVANCLCCEEEIHFKVGMRDRQL